MALSPCPECKHDVSDQASACPHCGMPVRSPARRRRMAMIAGGVVAVLALAGGGTALALRQHDYSRVEQLRAEQDAEGLRDEHVRQRFFRLYKRHPGNAMYAYLWARCVDDANDQLRLAEEGIHDDPAFAWSYNMAARALARLNRLPEAYERATKGLSLDPANRELARKQRSLKDMIDHKLADQPRPAPGAEKGAVRYAGLFGADRRPLDPRDLQAVQAARLQDYKGPVADAVRVFLVCTNPYADACIRAFVPRDARIKGWAPPGRDLAALEDHTLLTVTGSVVAGGRGEPIMLVDSVTVEGR